MNLTDFLLARIAEDERWAEEEIFPQPWRMGASRVLAECESKRRLVRMCALLVDGMWLGQRDLGDLQLRIMALPYADHPDYREEWKP